MKLIFCFLTIWLTGCVSMPGSVSVSESKTEGTKELYVEPGWIDQSFTQLFKLGLIKTSSMPTNEAYLIVAVKMNTADSVLINIDGEKTTLTPVDRLSDSEQGWFKKRFRIDIDTIKKMVNGKSVWVKVGFTGQTYVENQFSEGRTQSAKQGFTEFLTKLN